MTVWEARVKGDLGVPALETSLRYSLGQLAPHLASGRDLQACDNGGGLEFESNLAGSIGCSTGIRQGRLYSLISEPLSCSRRNHH